MARRDADDDEIPYGLWVGAVDRATYSRRGQQALRDLEQALLAIPDKRLAYEHIAHEGQVCAVGAYLAWQQQQAAPDKDRAAIVKELEAEHYDEDESLRWTARAGQEAGLAWSLAWDIASTNDYHFGRAHTPEQRWEDMLAWVRKRIRQPV
jgi:hypothetical protein